MPGSRPTRNPLGGAGRSFRAEPRLLAAALCVAAGGLAAYGLPAPGPAEPAAEEASGGRGELTELERRGRRIYRRGTSPSETEITALMGDDRIEVPATALPCSNCHGLDGRGRPEGGVSPSDLTWPSLTRPYGVRHESGREHPPYDERLVKRAITMGLDPAGNELHIAMPRYRMAIEDLGALVAYLKAIDADRDPGISDRALTLGQLLPPAGALPGIRRVLAGVVGEELRRVNEAGGVYGRQLRLVPLELPADPAARPAAVRRFLDDETIFALAPSFLAGADDELAELMRETEVPMVAPLTLIAADGYPVNRQVFYLWSGIAGQARALARFAGDGSDAPRSDVPGPAAAVLHSADGRLAGAAAAILDQLGSETEVETVQTGSRSAEPPDPAELVDRLAAGGVTDLYLLDTGPAVRAVLAAAAAAGWSPRLLVPGSLADGALLTAAADLGSPLWAAYPTLPGDRRGAPAVKLAERMEATGLPAAAETSAASAYAGVRLLIEGLETAGRELSRERLIAALEGLYDHPTGLTPPITFGPNRRVGARGAYVVPVSGVESGRGGGWVPVER